MKFFKSQLLYFLAPFLSLTILCVILQIWAIDLTLPIFDYSRDSLMSFFEAKTVIDSGWFFSNNLVGLPGNFVLHDFPMHADSLNFGLLKVFSYFSSNPFLIVNCFFISSFALVSLSSFAALRALNISVLTSLLISLIYTFTPYHFVRGTHHLFLSNYAIVPLIVLLAIWMLNGKIETFVLNQKNRLTFSFSKKFFIALLITICAAASGIYYSFFTIIIFAFVWILNGMRSGNFFERINFAAPIFIAIIVTILFYLHLPSMVYWTQTGFNSFVTSRAPQESATFALKIINLFLPIFNHYLDYFTNLRGSFEEFAYEEESGAESLGIMGCAGFLFLIMWLVSKNENQGQKNKNSLFQKTLTKFSLNEKEQNLISDLAILNIFLVLFFTASGFVMFIALPFPYTRSYARISIFIGFIALLALAIILDKTFQKKLFSSKKPAAIAFSVTLILGIFSLVIFDQVGRIEISPKLENIRSIQSDILKRKFFSDQKFITKIEEILPAGSAIFILPCEGFPEYRGTQDYELLIPYLHSKHLRWSYPAITGRDSYLWQEKISNMKFSDFLREVKKENFAGILIDRSHYASDRSWKELREMESDLKSKTKKTAITSPNGNLIFFQI